MAPLPRPSGNPLADRRFDYAQALAAQGESAAAADLIEQALELAPHWAAGWFALGEVRGRAGLDKGAAEAYRRALALEPEDALGAGPALAALGAGGLQAPSPAHVRALFDQYAPCFEAHLTTGLGYRGPALLWEAVRSVAEARGGRMRVPLALDLGCGTGLMGEVLRPHCNRLEGCDLSPAMVALAAARGVYDAVEVAELSAFLAGREPGTAGLVTAADVLVYLGDLESVFEAVARALSPSGLFAFTVQRHEGEGFALGPDRRAAHSEAHVRAAASGTGLAILRLEEASTRLDRGEPVPGLVTVLGR